MATTAHFQKTTKLTAYNFSMTMSSGRVGQRTPLNVPVGVNNATQSTKSYSASIQHQIDYLNSVGLTFSKSSVDFSGDPSGLLKSSNTLSISGSWLHHVNHTTDLTSQLGYLKFDSSLESDTIYSASEAINWKITKAFRSTEAQDSN